MASSQINVELFAASITILGFLAIGGGLFGLLIFQPLYRRTGISMAGSPFRLLDFIILAVQIQVVIAIENGARVDGELNSARLIIEVGLLGLAWMNAIWLLSRSSIEDAMTRVLFLAILGPIGFACGVLWTDLLATMVLEQMLTAALGNLNDFLASSALFAVGAIPVAIAVRQTAAWLSRRAIAERARRDGIEFES